MKNLLNILLITLASIALFSCNNDSRKSNEKNSPSSEIVDFSRTYEGQINNKYELVMQISSKDGVVSGRYFYKTVCEDLSLKGSINKNSEVKLSEYNKQGDQTGQFEGKMLDKDFIKGTFSKPNGDNPMPFELHKAIAQYDDIKKEIRSKNLSYITGTYRIPETNQVYSGEVRIKYLENDKFSFEMSVVRTMSGNNGQVNGTGVIDNNGIGRWSAKGCQSLIFKFTSSTLSVEETHCDLFHGNNCYFTNDYIKIK